MRYITPRKAATGLGSARSGTMRHWQLTVSAYALIILTPLFLAVVGGAIGLPREQVAMHFGRPFAGVITGLFIVVGMLHFMQGTRNMIDDYLRGGAHKGAIIASQVLGWGVIAAAIFALAKMALITPTL
ncbi:succinate dehydrogenase, hydrophobic membrane anchor protein [Paracoccus sp. (in: a-proteobacteria)]|uniref:succinate dehydrogenase, hydrophobic membrane anchor protein n=1 Tax=Paracoccus sp. TaxID=267 RepID=UPI0026E0774D|nr:succinate dehydrogenase, hydrophobic membrane anchor protein [Paracoccus sp. (in: a-proteobacteria)]MDO5646729.1 succinate dehydrogenase, hydrophobic membrane anchor protein [Paracoccus sp. (in: a-proteobacteria)]